MLKVSWRGKKIKEDKEIYYKATGLNKLDKKVIKAAYKIYEYLKTTRIVEDLEGGEVARRRELEPIDLREGVMIITNVENLIAAFGFERTFTIREASNALGVTTTIVSRWIDKAIENGLIEVVDEGGEIRYRVSRQGFLTALDSVKESIEKIRENLTSTDQISTRESTGRAREEVFQQTNREVFMRVLSEIESIIEKLVEEHGVDLSLTSIQKVRALMNILGNELGTEVINCLRIGRLLALNQIEVTSEDVDECKKVLEEMRSV